MEIAFSIFTEAIPETLVYQCSDKQNSKQSKNASRVSISHNTHHKII